MVQMKSQKHPFKKCYNSFTFLAGYLLSYLPKDVFRTLIPPLERAQENLLGRAAEEEEFRPVGPFTEGGLYEMEDDYVEYLQPSASFVRPFAVANTERRERRRRVKKEEGL